MIPAPSLSAEDLAVFAPLAKRYFETISGDAPEFGESSIDLGEPELGMLTGFIPVEGPVHGWVAITFGTDLADEMLSVLEEPSRDEETRRDLAGEIVSTIASNARWHFGKHLTVKPAVATANASIPAELNASPLIFQVPFQWRAFNGALLISLTP
jgi:CheY-specific phosphatase CheX